MQRSKYDVANLLIWYYVVALYLLRFGEYCTKMFVLCRTLFSKVCNNMEKCFIFVAVYTVKGVVIGINK